MSEHPDEPPLAAPGSAADETRAHRNSPPWVFGISSVPFGMVGVFVGAVMPFILRKAGVAVDRIAEISAMALIPSMLQFLWAPTVDIGLRRRSWLILLSLLGAACLFVAMCLPLPERLDLFVVLVVAAQGLTGLTGSCNGGLISRHVDKDKLGRAGAWLNVGNLGAGGVGAYVTLWLTSHAGVKVAAAAMSAMIVLPSLSVLLVDEPQQAARGAGDLFRGMLHDIWATAKSRPGWTGMVICLSPVGTAVAINLFSGIAVDYHASDDTVTWVNGSASALLTAIGCLGGGWICDRMNRRLAYVCAGALTAICGVVMAFAPLTELTYEVGACVYMLITGFCYAAFSAFVLDIVGNQEGAAASTRYTLYTAAANGAIAYVTWADGKGYKQWGPRGLLGVDAAANLAGIVFLVGMMWLLLRRDGSQKQAPASLNAA